MAVRLHRKSQRGFSMIELLPLLVVFILLINYAVGMWGAVHTGILHSIAARNYAFETFRNRPRLIMHRYDSEGCLHNQGRHFRYHAIIDDNGFQGDGPVVATARRTSMTGTAAIVGDELDVHNSINEMEDRNRNKQVSPIWVKVGYGICLDVQCQPSN